MSFDENVLAHALNAYEVEIDALGEAADTDVGDGQARSAKNRRCKKDKVAVDNAGFNEGAGQSRATLDVDRAQTTTVEFGKNCFDVASSWHDRRVWVLVNQ